MKPRDYQERLITWTDISISGIYSAPLIVLPTGGGKTVVASGLASLLTNRGECVWFLAHRKELISQASKTFGVFNVPHGILKSGHHYAPDAPAQVGSIQTVARRLSSIHRSPDVIIVDEAHHATAATYRKIFAAFPDARIVGITATPIRTNGDGLGGVFDEMILGPSSEWLTENGFLSPARYYAPPQKADLTGVAKRAGDYVVEQLERVMDTSEITGDAVEHYRRLADGKTALVYCASVAHAEHVAAQYRDAGYRAESVDGKLSDAERDRRLGGLETGEIQVITSCDLISEGLDVPAVSVVQLLRPTESLIVHLQQIGRGLRPAKGKDYLVVLDHVGNTMKHGFATTPREWSLEGRKRSAPSSAHAIKTCPDCYQVSKPSKMCPHCGFTYPIVTRALTAKKVIDGKLVEVVQTKEERAAEVRAATSYAELVAIGKARGYKRPHFWAKNIRLSWGRKYKMPTA
jgi:DNA repair protein RadD